MSDETYYTVLNVSETASLSEIKTAYRELIKQVHPDTISNLAPYLRRIAEEKAKEITEAYSVLSSSSKRREYDRQLAEYRRQTTPQTPPPPPAQQAASQSSSAPHCNWCGAPLYASGGFCPKCHKFNAPAGSPQQPTAVRWLGYNLGHNWATLRRWSGEHPLLAAITIAFFWAIVVLVSYSNTSPQAPAEATQAASASKAAAPATGAYAIASQEATPTKPTVSVAGTYIGTVHNQTANLSSSATVVLHQTKSGLLEGCMDVKPPLFGSGLLRGSIQGAHLSFVVSEITYQGDVSKDEIAGSYGVSRQDGDQVGNFHLLRQKGAGASYECANGVLTKVATAASQSGHSQRFGDVPHGYKVLPPPAKSQSALHAMVIGNFYSTLYKRCAFLPSDNFGRCNWGPMQVAALKGGDRVTVLSPLTRAENGADIYKVRTEQGWVGWIDAQGVTLDPQ